MTIRDDLTADGRTAAFEIELKQGWKVSAPDQPPGAVLKSLAATWVSADGNTLQAAVNSEAKNWVQGEFGQSFSGLQKLSITRPSLWQDKPLSLRLQLQVCSTSVCLLPENFWLAFPSAQE